MKRSIVMFKSYRLHFWHQKWAEPCRGQGKKQTAKPSHALFSTGIQTKQQHLLEVHTAFRKTALQVATVRFPETPDRDL